MSALARFGIVVGTAALGISMYRPKREPRGKMETVAGKTVLVTGAAQGLGRLFATKAVDEKAGHVILWDVDRKGLTKTKEDLTNRGGKVRQNIHSIRHTGELAVDRGGAYSHDVISCRSACTSLMFPSSRTFLRLLTRSMTHLKTFVHKMACRDPSSFVIIAAGKK
jgi:hypothetical protein